MKSYEIKLRKKQVKPSAHCYGTEDVCHVPLSGGKKVPVKVSCGATSSLASAWLAPSSPSVTL